MTAAIKVVLVVILIGAAVVAVLRLRKLHRDDARARIANRETHPTSPYVAAKGFRLVGDADQVPSPLVRRSDPSKPRLDPGRNYVFSDGQAPSADGAVSPTGRRDSKWALERSAHRPRFSASGRRLFTAALIVIAALIVAGFFLHHHHAPARPVGIERVGGRASQLPATAVNAEVHWGSGSPSRPRETAIWRVDSYASAPVT